MDSQASTCVFCRIASEPNNDDSNFVVYRGANAFVVLNLFPYITGHLLVIPYQHLGELDSTAKEITDELMDLIKRSQAALRKVYSPQGYNVGMNLGAAAGAGIVDHIHWHVLPRWSGDTNFMTTVANGRVIPEALETTYAKLKGQL